MLGGTLYLHVQADMANAKQCSKYRIGGIYLCISIAGLNVGITERVDENWGAQMDCVGGEMSTIAMQMSLAGSAWYAARHVGIICKDGYTRQKKTLWS
jgi:hypothetical protein